MIACAFPPIGGAGVQRSAKFAKYLGRFGWEPIVWSARSLPGMPTDATLLSDLPRDLKRYTTHSFDPSAYVSRVCAHLSRWAGNRDASGRAIGAVERKALRAAFVLRSLCVPDDQASWALRSFRPARRVARRHRVDAVFSTFSPPSNHLLGMWIARALAVPWVADFRDLWIDDTEAPSRGIIRAWLDRSLELKFLRRADAVTTTTQMHADMLESKVPDRADRFVTITNGFDPDDLPNDLSSRFADRRTANRAFRLVHVGQLREARCTQEIVEGIARFARSVGESKPEFEFRAVGAISPAVLRQAAARGLNINAVGRLPHRAAVREMLEADVLLLPQAGGHNGHTVIPGKTFEYLASGRPILVIGAGDAEVARLVESVGGGVAVPRDAEAIERALREHRDAIVCGCPKAGCASADASRFSRIELASVLAGVLDRVVSAGRVRKTSMRFAGRSFSPQPEMA